jgi:hypothetical protein
MDFFIIVQYSGRDCNVLPYSDNHEAVTGAPIVTGVTVWTDQETGGKTWIILIHHDEEASIWMADTMHDAAAAPPQSDQSESATSIQEEHCLMSRTTPQGGGDLSSLLIRIPARAFFGESSSGDGRHKYLF